MKNVMIVDDSIFIYEEMKGFLEDTDFNVIDYARSGEEALDKYEKVKPDIVTMDIILPGIDGLETTRALLKRWPDARILIISSLAYDDTIQEANKSGAKEFLYKPFDQDILLEALHKCLE